MDIYMDIHMDMAIMAIMASMAIMAIMAIMASMAIIKHVPSKYIGHGSTWAMVLHRPWLGSEVPVRIEACLSI